MTDTLKVFGPPGTGKTTTGVNWLEGQIQGGHEPEAAGFVSFTNAACDEARRRLSSRLDLYGYELPYCATLHALCRRALRIEGRDWLAEGKRLKEFAAEYDYAIGPAS